MGMYRDEGPPTKELNASGRKEELLQDLSSLSPSRAHLAMTFGYLCTSLWHLAWAFDP